MLHPLERPLKSSARMSHTLIPKQVIGRPVPNPFKHRVSTALHRSSAVISDPNSSSRFVTVSSMRPTIDIPNIPTVRRQYLSPWKSC